METTSLCPLGTLMSAETSQGHAEGVREAPHPEPVCLGSFLPLMCCVTSEVSFLKILGFLICDTTAPALASMTPCYFFFAGEGRAFS